MDEYSIANYVLYFYIGAGLIVALCLFSVVSKFTGGFKRDRFYPIDEGGEKKLKNKRFLNGNFSLTDVTLGIMALTLLNAARMITAENEVSLKSILFGFVYVSIGVFGLLYAADAYRDYKDKNGKSDHSRNNDDADSF